jgi:hypothetical protein
MNAPVLELGEEKTKAWDLEAGEENGKGGAADAYPHQISAAPALKLDKTVSGWIEGLLGSDSFPSSAPGYGFNAFLERTSSTR